MTAKIIDGKEISQAVREEYRQRAEKLKDKGVLPGLAVIIVGDNPASRIYVRNKIKACHVRGATRILDSVEESTGIKPGETDLDLKFSVETVNCLGCCALGPVVEVNGKVHGKMTPVKTSEALKLYE